MKRMKSFKGENNGFASYLSDVFYFIGGWERKKVISSSLTFQLNQHLHSAQVLVLHNSGGD